DPVRGGLRLQHRRAQGEHLVAGAHAGLDAHRLAARQAAQLLDAVHQPQRGVELGAPRPRDAVMPLLYDAGTRDLRGDLVARQQSAHARLRTLAELGEDALDLRVIGLDAELLGVEVAIVGAAAKVAGADLPDQVRAVFQVVLGQPALTSLLDKAAHRRTLI